MTKTELIDKIAKNKTIENLTKKQVSQVVDALFDELGEYFVKSKVSKKEEPKLTYPAFGTFKKKKRNSKKGRNPKTGEEMTIPAHFTVTFTPSSILKDKMNSKNKKKK